MQAIVYERYGSPDVLRLEGIERPTPSNNEVLIRVRAASVNPLDWHFMRGLPYFLRIGTGLRKPKNKHLGVDVAGQVEAIGRSVTQFKPGDAVFGTCKGAFAEYTCTSELALVMKPDNITFEQAASVPIAALTALQGLRNKGRIRSGQKVLINGAAGGVGTFAVQIAKSFDTEVTGVCGTRNVEMVRSIGADRVIDYTKDDFTKSTQRYDVILDCVGNHSFPVCRRILSPKGICVGVGGPSGRWMIGPLVSLITALVLSQFSNQKQVTVLAKLNKEDLTTMSEFLTSGEVTPVIDRRYSLRQVAAAIQYLEEGHARGKVVIALE
jgi:NADPH:quinone reductase-like Zn-dependent oxidoreductase